MLILCRPHYTRWHTTDKNRFSVTFPIFTDHFKIFDISRYSRWVATLRRMARLSWPQQLAVTRWFINAVQRSMQVDFRLTIKYYDDDKLLLSTIDNTIKHDCSTAVQCERHLQKARNHSKLRWSQINNELCSTSCQAFSISRNQPSMHLDSYVTTALCRVHHSLSHA